MNIDFEVLTPVTPNHRLGELEDACIIDTYCDNGVLAVERGPTIHVTEVRFYGTMRSSIGPMKFKTFCRFIIYFKIIYKILIIFQYYLIYYINILDCFLFGYKYNIQINLKLIFVLIYKKKKLNFKL